MVIKNQHHGNGLYIFLLISLVMVIYLLLILIMILSPIYRHLGGIIGEVRIVIRWISLCIRVERLEIRLLIMIVMVFLGLILKLVVLMNMISAKNRLGSVWPSSVTQLAPTSQSLKNISTLP